MCAADGSTSGRTTIVRSTAAAALHAAVMTGDEEAPRLWPGLPGDSVALLSRHPCARDLATLRRVSRAWRDDVDADAVWAHAFATRWPVRERMTRAE